MPKKDFNFYVASRQAWPRKKRHTESPIWKQVVALCLALAGITAALVTLEAQCLATPLIALRESSNCGGCHKPGRSQLPPWQRRCTLDCQGCHIDPAGGGPRNQWGSYYSQDQAPSVSFFQPVDPLDDSSFFDLHYDGRNMNRVVDGKTRTFPMSSEFGVRVRPMRRYLHLTYQNLLLGRIEDRRFRILSEGDRRFREKYSVMVDSLPFNTYLRNYRGAPMYGLRRSNHSLWIRERIGLDQFATTDAWELGLTPNVPFFRASKMSGDPYATPEFRQAGSSFHGGLRGVTLGWHVNGSGWDTESATHRIKMNAVGAGLNVFQVLLYGERNTRVVTTETEAASDPTAPTRIHPSSTITEYTLAFAGIRGVMFGVIAEDMVTDLSHRRRTNYFIDLHPIPWIQVELWQRHEYGETRLDDTLALLHVYGDF